MSAVRTFPPTIVSRTLRCRTSALRAFLVKRSTTVPQPHATVATLREALRSAADLQAPRRAVKRSTRLETPRWWPSRVLLRDDRRNGVQRPVMSEEHMRGLLAWAAGSKDPLPVGIVDVVLIPELLKAVRSVTGFGLAEVAAIVSELPVRLVAGTTREKAEELCAQLVAAGGTAELR